MRRLSSYIAASILLHGILLTAILYMVRASEQNAPSVPDMTFEIIRESEMPDPPPVESPIARPAPRSEPQSEAAPQDRSLEKVASRVTPTGPEEPAARYDSGVDFRASRSLRAYLGTPSLCLADDSGTGHSDARGHSTTGLGRAGSGTGSSDLFLPEALLLPLALAYEGAAFYAAYKADSKPAMAAVAGLSLVKGAVGHSVGKVAHRLAGTGSDAAELGELTSRQLDILCALWDQGPTGLGSLYLALPGGWTFTDLRESLDRMRKAHLVRLRGKGLEALCSTSIDRNQVLKALSARPSTSHRDLVRVAALGISSAVSHSDTLTIPPR